jgi:hypothetical protein
MPYQIDTIGLTFDGVDPATGVPVTFDGGGLSKKERKVTMKVLLETNNLTTLGGIQLGQGIHTHLTGNANFTAPIPSLPDLQAAIDAAQAALDESNMAFDTLRMKRAERRAATKALIIVLESLAGYVQAASGGDEAKILSAGMAVRPPAEPVGPLGAPQNLRATIGELEGTSQLEWDSMYGARSFHVECATGANGPWNPVTSVTGTRVVVNSLTSGTKYFFRVRALGAAGYGPWSDIAMKMAA